MMMIKMRDIESGTIAYGWGCRQCAAVIDSVIDTHRQWHLEPRAATFPPSAKCATATPCRNVTGEVVKIEESYWIQFPNGQQTHIRVKPDTKIDSRVKVGDSLAAQLTSTGDADAVIKLSEKPQAVELAKPDKSLTDVR
jgi:hypothetical protein